jgi:hypothetical protein
MLIAWLCGAMMASAAETPQATISIQLVEESRSPRRWLAETKTLATLLLAQAGLRIEWCDTPLACPDWRERIVITLRRTAPAAAPPHALAEAHAFEGHTACIFLNRLYRRGGGRLLPRLLAHTIAHETTHLLCRCEHHASHGVMKAQWSPKDLDTMMKAQLSFTADDLAAIGRGLYKRAESQESPLFRRLGHPLTQLAQPAGHLHAILRRFHVQDRHRLPALGQGLLPQPSRHVSRFGLLELFANGILRRLGLIFIRQRPNQFIGMRRGFENRFAGGHHLTDRAEDARRTRGRGGEHNQVRRVPQRHPLVLSKILFQGHT